jgi:hypothetical protein
MARFVLDGSILRKILIVTVCVLASACAEAPVALAQTTAVAGTSAGGTMGAPHVFAPSSAHVPCSTSS